MREKNCSNIILTLIMPMFKSIKTSKANKEVVQRLTQKLSLGPENIIARIAFAYSIANENKFELTEAKDSGGKEYSANVLFGENSPYYIALICENYGIYRNDKDIARYVKLHIDDGLEKLDKRYKEAQNLDNFEFLGQLIDEGISEINTQ